MVFVLFCIAYSDLQRERTIRDVAVFHYYYIYNPDASRGMCQLHAFKIKSIIKQMNVPCCVPMTGNCVRGCMACVFVFHIRSNCIVVVTGTVDDLLCINTIII